MQQDGWGKLMLVDIRRGCGPALKIAIVKGHLNVHAWHALPMMENVGGGSSVFSP